MDPETTTRLYENTHTEAVSHPLLVNDLAPGERVSITTSDYGHKDVLYHAAMRAQVAPNDPEDNRTLSDVLVDVTDLETPDPEENQPQEQSYAENQEL